MKRLNTMFKLSKPCGFLWITEIVLLYLSTATSNINYSLNNKEVIYEFGGIHLPLTILGEDFVKFASHFSYTIITVSLLLIVLTIIAMPWADLTVNKMSGKIVHFKLIFSYTQKIETITYAGYVFDLMVNYTYELITTNAPNLLNIIAQLKVDVYETMSENLETMPEEQKLILANFLNQPDNYIYMVDAMQIYQDYQKTK